MTPWDKKKFNNVWIIDGLKEMNIRSNRASIDVHRTLIIDHLNTIFGTEESSWSKQRRKHLNALKNIPEEDMGLNIINPVIAIATKLESTFISPDKEFILKHKDAFRESLLSLLKLAKHTKDQRIKDHTLQATDLFLALSQ